MDDHLKDVIDQGMADAARGMPRRAATVVQVRADRLPSLSHNTSSLDEAFGALPMRFIRAARETAKQMDCAAEWAAVEAAYDAIVSARE